MIELKLTKGRAFDVLLEAINRIWEKARKKEIEIEMDAEDGRGGDPDFAGSEVAV